MSLIIIEDAKRDGFDFSKYFICHFFEPSVDNFIPNLLVIPHSTPTDVVPKVSADNNCTITETKISRKLVPMIKKKPP